MHTIYVDGRSCGDAKAVHLLLKMLLDLPSYYGCNLDALNDCLSERRPVRLYVAAWGNEAAAA